MEAINPLSGTTEELTGTYAPAGGAEAPLGEGDERRDDTYEARIIRLDRAAAEALLRLVGL